MHSTYSLKVVLRFLDSVAVGTIAVKNRRLCGSAKDGGMIDGVMCGRLAGIATPVVVSAPTSVISRIIDNLSIGCNCTLETLQSQALANHSAPASTDSFGGGSVSATVSNRVEIPSIKMVNASRDSRTVAISVLIVVSSYRIWFQFFGISSTIFIRHAKVVRVSFI